MENHHAINGKIHYFYGHFPLQTVSSPEGNKIHGQSREFSGWKLHRIWVLKLGGFPNKPSGDFPTWNMEPEATLFRCYLKVGGGWMGWGKKIYWHPYTL